MKSAVLNMKWLTEWQTDLKLGPRIGGIILDIDQIPQSHTFQLFKRKRFRNFPIPLNHLAI